MTAQINRRGERGRAPLSAEQQRIWLAMERREPVHPLAAMLEIEGVCATAALAAGLTALARRHAILRATVMMDRGRPVQSFADAPPPALRVAEASEADAAVRMHDAAGTTFDLASAPGWRALALRVAPARTLVVLTMHPLIADARSLVVAARDLAALLGGTPLVSLPLDYGDFAAWQRTWLTSEDAQVELARRVEVLAPLPALELVQRRRSAGGPTARKADISAPHALAARVHQQSVALARESGLQVRHVILAAFAALLGRLSAGSACVIAVARRADIDAAFDEVIGNFDHDVAVAIDLTGDPSLRTLVDRVRAALAQPAGNIPIDRVLEHTPDGGHLVAARVVEMPPHDVPAAGNIAVTLATLVIPAGPDLELRIDTAARGSAISLAHDGSRFDRMQIEHIAEQLVALLTQAVARPDAPVAHCSLLTEGTRSLLPDLSSPMRVSEQEPVIEAIDRQATRAPAAIAIAQGMRAVSYGALESASRTLAQTLVAAGVGRGDTVLVCGDLCPGRIVAMAGVLRSGAVLFPLDATVPPERRALMLRAAPVKAAVVAGDPNFDVPVPLRIEVSPETGSVVGSMPVAPTLPSIGRDDPAYVFFTSGTTGVPKAVLGQHKGLAHFLRWQREAFAIGSADRAAQLMRPTFSVMLRDIFMPLTAGATLCLPPVEWAAMGASALVEWFVAERITITHAVPTLLQHWLTGHERRVHAAMRIVFSTGEPLTAAVVEQCRAVFGRGCRIVNMYGATETTMSRTFFEVPEPPVPGIQSVGRALPDTHVLVLTDAGQLAGVGEPGEVVIRTPFLAVGYLDAPADTRFRRNPFRDDADDRVFHTGDRGCVEADGTLSIIGRVDDQLKIRGVRVEPAEVTAVIQSHPDVADGVAIAIDAERGRALAAYIVPRLPGLTERALRAWLALRLPEALLPSSITLLARMPINANGKLDRANLPLPRMAREVRVAPRDAMEATLAEIWNLVLGTQDLGVHDDFFDVGGDSLSAARVLSRIRLEFGVEFNVGTLFRATTIAELALEITNVQSSELASASGTSRVRGRS